MTGIVVALICESVIALLGVLSGKSESTQKYSAWVYAAAIAGTLAICLR